MTGNMVAKLILNQTCDLTPLNSLNQHKVLLYSLIKLGTKYIIQIEKISIT